MGMKFEKDLLNFNGKKITPSVRTLAEMRSVLAHPENDDGMKPDFPLYFMYREAARFSHIQRAAPSVSPNAAHSWIRYDITRIVSAEICGERNKTFGHVHPPFQKGTAWSEVYEVLEGSAHFLLQKVNGLGVQDAVLLTGKKGDRLMVPPGYGHVTINTGKTDLVLANLVSDLFESDYSMYAQRRGACFYELADGKLVKNKNYGEDFELRKADAVKFSSAFGVYAPFAKKTLLDAAKDYANIEFLEKPEMFY